MEKISQGVWPPLVRKVFEAKQPISEYIRDWAGFNPDGIALCFYGWDISYAELNRDIDRFAQGLVAAGLKKGDRVAVFMQNCPQFVISFFGILRAGGIIVALNPMFKQGELEYEINDAGANILVALDYLYPEVEKIEAGLHLRHTILCSLTDYVPQEPLLPLPSEALNPKQSFAGTLDFMDFLDRSADTPICNVDNMEKDLALLQYTGGTTGLPKGAMISHHSLTYACLGTVDWFKHRFDDVFLGVTPFFHIMGMQQLMCTPLMAGAKVVVLSRFDSKVTAKAIELYRCTFWVTATTSLIAFLEMPGIDQYNFSSLRCLVSGGTPISVEIQKKISRFVPNAVTVEGYGLTECVSQGGVVTPLLRHKSGFVGIPQMNQVKVVDLETGREELPAGQEGEIIIKGPTVMAGYWKRPEETQMTIKDGWLYTGDIGVFDEEGYLKIVGRGKELIKCSGFSVFPTEVENLLFRHPAVSEVAVIGIPDPYRGESPKAFIILKSEYRTKTSREDILEWCKENMSAYKRPRNVEFVEELPRSAAGKILRRVLVEKENKKGGE